MATEEKQEWLDRMPPVYHSARRLLLQLMASTGKADRRLKYGAVSDAANLVLAVMTDIAFADKRGIETFARISFIATAQVKMDEVKVRIRVLYDAKAVKKPGFSAITDLERNVDIQLAKWKASLEKDRNV